MRMKHLIAAALTALTLSGCSLVYRIDIPQGNYVEQKQVDKLRQGMTREQVEFAYYFYLFVYFLTSLKTNHIIFPHIILVYFFHYRKIIYSL